MPLTFAERKKYLRDRVVNAYRMLSHGNFRLFRDSLVFEVNHVRNLLKMHWRSRRETADSGQPGRRFVNRARVLPGSWRPTVLRQSSPPSLPGDATELAAELRKIRLRLQPRQGSEKKSKWPRFRF